MINKNLCDRFMLLMRELNVSQKKYAQKLGITESRISDIKKYRLEPSKIMIERLVKEYKVNYIWLIEGKGEIFYNELNEAQKQAENTLNYPLINENRELEKTLLILADTNNKLVENYQKICDKLLSILDSSKK